MKILFISFIFLFILLFVPFSINAKTHTNFIKFVGFYSINLLFFNIFAGKVEINDYKLHIINLNKKRHKITVFKKRFFSNMMKLLQDISITNFVVVGKKNDAYTAALSYGAINSIFSGMFAYLQSTKKHCMIQSRVQPTTSADVLLITGAVSVRLNLFMVLIAFLQTLLKKESVYGK